MNRTLLEPEYFIYVSSSRKKGGPQYEAFIKMLKADEEEFMDFLEKITSLEDIIRPPDPRPPHA